MREHGTNACYRFGPEPGHDWLMAPVIAHRMRFAEQRAHYRALERERREAS